VVPGDVARRRGRRAIPLAFNRGGDRAKFLWPQHFRNRHYETIRTAMAGVFRELGVAA